MKNLDELLEAARQSPVEVEISSIEDVIYSFDAKDVDVLDSANTIFNWKMLLMVSIPFFALISVYVLSDYNSGELQNEQLVGAGTKELVDTIPALTELERLDPLESDRAEALTPASEVIDPIQPVHSLSIQLSPKQDSTPMISGIGDRLRFESSLSKLDDLPDLESMSSISRLQPIGALAQLEGTPPPNLSDRQMKRMKKTLYAELYLDGLITSESAEVLLELKGTTILVDSMRLNDVLAEKYKAITAIAGYGPRRAIKLSERLILVGDFYGEEFKGSGTGLFPPEVISTTELLQLNSNGERLGFETEHTIMHSDEWDKLDVFADSVLANAPLQQGKKRLLSVDLTARNMVSLYQMLQRQLLDDEHISKPSDDCVLGFGESIITINGASLSQENSLPYYAIFNAFNIKSGQHREVRMNDKIIGVGDFKYGKFRGTIWNVTQ